MLASDRFLVLDCSWGNAYIGIILDFPLGQALCLVFLKMSVS